MDAMRRAVSARVAALALGVLLAASPAHAQQPLPKVAPQPSSMTPAEAMQLNGLPPGLPAAEVLSFDDAVARSLARNPSVKVAREEIARVRAIVEETRAASMPTLSANAVYTRLDQDR